MRIQLGDHTQCVEDLHCSRFALDTLQGLDTGKYEFPASVLSLQDLRSHMALHRTFRKRANRCEDLGYTYGQLSRHLYHDDIHAINISLPERQGRPMSAGYLVPPSFGELPFFPCPRHRIDYYGVFLDGRLVAYTVIYVSGRLAMISQILGHGEHLKQDVMYLLMRCAFEETLQWSGPVLFFYNMHNSGTDGLRYFKERLGFQPERVEWAL